VVRYLSPHAGVPGKRMKKEGWWGWGQQAGGGMDGGVGHRLKCLVRQGFVLEGGGGGGLNPPWMASIWGGWVGWRGARGRGPTPLRGPGGEVCGWMAGTGARLGPICGGHLPARPGGLGGGGGWERVCGSTTTRLPRTNPTNKSEGGAGGEPEGGGWGGGTSGVGGRGQSRPAGGGNRRNWGVEGISPGRGARRFRPSTTVPPRGGQTPPVGGGGVGGRPFFRPGQNESDPRKKGARDCSRWPHRKGKGYFPGGRARGVLGFFPGKGPV